MKTIFVLFMIALSNSDPTGYSISTFEFRSLAQCEAVRSNSMAEMRKTTNPTMLAALASGHWCKAVYVQNSYESNYNGQTIFTRN
jgi:hypothetical protein